MIAADALRSAHAEHRRPRSFGLCALAAFALAVALGLTPALADPASWEADWSFAMRSGNFAKAGQMLTEPAAGELATSPKHLFAAARSGAVYLPIGLVKGRADQLFVPKWFASAGTQLQASATEPNAEVARALAAVAGVVCRCAGAIGSGAELADVQAVAAHTLEFYERSPASDGGALLADALGWMRAPIEVDGIDHAAVLAAQQDLFTKLSAKATGATLALAKAELEMGKAVGSADVAEAKACVERCLALLKPLTSAVPPPPGPSTLTNEALDCSSRRKLGVRGDYVTEEQQTTDHELRIGVPIGLGWRNLGPLEKATFNFERSEGGSVRLFDVQIFPGELKGTYKGPAGDVVNGSDLKGLATQRLDIDEAALHVGVKKRGPIPVSVGHGFAQGYYTEVAGKDDQYRPVVRRGWVVKGKYHPHAYNILVLDFTTSEGVPPELQAVIDSITEVKIGK